MNESPHIETQRMSRQLLLKRAGVAAASVGIGGALAGCGPNESVGSISGDVNASQLPAMPRLQPAVSSFLTLREIVTLSAVVARLIPGDTDDPGAVQAGVPMFIDMKLAQFQSFATPTYFDPPFAKPVGYPPGPQERPDKSIAVQASELPRYGFQSNSTPQDAYRKGLAALDRFSRKQHRKRFAELDEATQDAVLSVVEAGKAGGWPDAKDFFKMVLEDTYEGMFSDPVYGGNQDYAGWKLLDYPGAQRAYTPYEMTHGPQQKRVQGLRDMPAMNPGVPQDHVILPIAGTRQPKGS